MRFVITYELRRVKLTFLTGNVSSEKEAKRALKEYVSNTWPKFGKPKITRVSPYQGIVMHQSKEAFEAYKKENPELFT